ncbi:MAG: PDZ domain-containing protein [Proteobacteria bacterium]|nr:PDZ domain-containing protein [Pseudomonadota bacterium]
MPDTETDRAASVKSATRYKIEAARPNAHLFDIELEISEPDSKGQQLSLPAWVPGSYRIRDFARHITSLSARSLNDSVAVKKLDKSTWQCAPVNGRLTIHYQVYAKDRSVRGAYLDQRHGFFDGSNIFLRAHGQEEWPSCISISPPSGDTGHWQLATGLQVVQVNDRGFGDFQAQSYAELIDCPIEMGDLDFLEFSAGGIPHTMAISGKHDADKDRLATDLALICHQHIDLFGSVPVDNYLFLLTVVSDGYGGLEHRNSSSLISRRDDLPAQAEDGISKGYRRFLGLCSHEYFHMWNVKRLRPAALAESDLSAEAYTEMLWVFEGVTSYYDDLALVRSGVITDCSYLELLSQTITRVLQGPGRLHQSLAESSFDAWSKFYQQNENSPNAIVSYYAKGSLVALALDLLIRSETNGACSLDDVMRAVWDKYGQSETGMPETAFEDLASEISGLELKGFFDNAVRGTDDLPLAEYLETVGVVYKERPAVSLDDPGGSVKGKSIPVWLGIKTRVEAGRLLVTHVLENGPGQKSGLSAGDELLALNDIRLTGKTLVKRLRRLQAGQNTRLKIFRDDVLIELPLLVEKSPQNCCQLQIDEKADNEILTARSAWLDGTR